MDFAESPSSSDPVTSGRSSRRGCFFWGGLALLLTTLSVGGSLWYAYYKLKSDLEDFASDEAMEVPIEAIADIDAASRKIDQLRNMEEEVFSELVALTLDDLNTLVAKHPQTKALRGKLKFRSEGDDLLLDVSVPLDTLGVEALAGKFFNGTLRVGVVFEDHGDFRVQCSEGLSPDGRKLSSRVLRLLSEGATNILNREMKAHERAIEKLEFKDGQFLITPRPAWEVHPKGKKVDGVKDGDANDDDVKKESESK